VGPSESSIHHVAIPSLPGFRLEEVLGRGGKGTVFRATQIEKKRAVAIKFLSTDVGGPLAIDAFQRESRLMAALSHPNIVTVYACGQQDGVHYIVMEYVSGPSLRAILRPGEAWPIAHAAAVLDGIGQALEYIHGEGALHLDLKPENVLCPAPGQVKITDFGLAVRSVDVRALSALGLAQGTIDYCSPEQRYGLPIDARSDLFSLATMAYELLTGTLPGRVFVPSRRRNPNLPARVDDVLQMALARDPDDRYASVEPFRRDLADALRSQ